MKHLAPAALLLAFGSLLPAQDSPTLRTQARLVIVDVVVTGKDHAPVHGLKQTDFKVFDRGTPQPIRFFEEHTSQPATAKLPVVPPMPPGTFTDFAAAPLDPTLNILLLDTLNTPVSDQNYFNSRIRDFLARLRPGSAVAIFALSSKLRLLQGFTTDQEAIRKAIDAPRNRSSPLLASPADGVDRVEGVDSLIESEQAAGTLTDNLTSIALESKALEFRTRVLLTIDELSTLARYLNDVPGRKNLVWATGGFSLSIAPAEGAGLSTFHEVISFESEFRGAIKLLAQSQTAVYTIEPQGLAAPPSGDIRSSFSNAAAATAADTAAFRQSVDVHGMMNMISDETGGRAFYYTNAVGTATAEALEEGANYYSLAFVPEVSKRKEDFRKLSVQLAREGYELHYRRGYYPEGTPAPPAPIATDKPESTDPALATLRLRAYALQQAMGHGLPATSQILYKVRILPSTAAPESVQAATSPAVLKVRSHLFAVDFSASPQDLSFTRGEDGNFHARLRFVTLLYLPDGRLANRSSKVLDTTLTPAGYRAQRQTGFNFHQEILIPDKGDFSLRTGIQDLNSGRIGTIEVDAAPLRKLPPLAADPTPHPPETTTAGPASTTP